MFRGTVSLYTRQTGRNFKLLRLWISIFILDHCLLILICVVFTKTTLKCIKGKFWANRLKGCPRRNIRTKIPYNLTSQILNHLQNIWNEREVCDTASLLWINRNLISLPHLVRDFLCRLGAAGQSWQRIFKLIFKQNSETKFFIKGEGWNSKEHSCSSIMEQHSLEWW